MWGTPLGASDAVPRVDVLRGHPITAWLTRSDLRAAASDEVAGAVELDVHNLQIWRALPAAPAVLDQMLRENEDVDGFVVVGKGGLAMVRLLLRGEAAIHRVRVIGQHPFSTQPGVAYLPRRVVTDPAYAARRETIRSGLASRYALTTTGAELDDLATSYPDVTSAANLFKAVQRRRAAASPLRRSSRRGRGLGRYDADYRHGDPMDQPGAYWGCPPAARAEHAA